MATLYFCEFDAILQKERGRDGERMDDSDVDVAILLHMGATKEVLEPILDPCPVIYEFCQ